MVKCLIFNLKLQFGGEQACTPASDLQSILKALSCNSRDQLPSGGPILHLTGQKRAKITIKKRLGMTTLKQNLSQFRYFEEKKHLIPATAIRLQLRFLSPVLARAR